MALSVDDVVKVSVAYVARQHGERVEISGVSPSAPGLDVLEVWLTIHPGPGRDRRRHPRRVLAAVRGLSKRTVEQDLQQRLALALRGRP